MKTETTTPDASRLDGVLVNKLLNAKELKEILGVSVSQLYKLMALPVKPLPAQRRLGTKTSRWMASEIKAWMEDLPVATRH